MALTRFTLRQFEAFSSVAEMRSFAAASEQMGLSSSAVSQLVAELESTIGFRVFDRSTRRVELSSAGRDFLGSVKSVLRHVHMAESAASDVRNRASGVVRIGAPLVLAGAILPSAIKAFSEDRPKVVIRIRDTPVDDLLDRVASGDLDLAVGPDRSGIEHVEAIPVFDSPWVLWCSPAHPLAQCKSLKWADLRNAHIVSAGRDHERSVAQMRLNAPEGSRILPVDVVDNVSTALGIAAQGLAATLAPAYISAMAAPLGLVMRRVKDPEAIRQVCIYRSTVRAAPPAAEAFAEFLKEWLQQWQADEARRMRAPRATGR
ncbi:MAG: LysR family transcriptional regulator [Acidovorax sp. SCN 65-28]|uniref:LysR family transcriptional regulator n=1 Tax=Acidovorax sp. TaxID=1872122 RepID=UPI0008687E5F|nr:LysR family transcriptional regulator [Acidovorax sp.]MBN9628238.1 LysR family transcriptional regulator [Acidovorax sp.]ODS79337.1 MAG: LysR family transcriptional regulator [Acidovorax sp. SCN 65-28]OJT98735.1 MAG: LysR family transcriptional regulator [Acidovorax sp. 65-7]